jgi:hypothetical protein
LLPVPVLEQPYSNNDRPNHPNSNVCFYYRRKGHIIKDCFKKKWRDTQTMGEEVHATGGGEKISPDWEPQSKSCWNYNA